MIFYYQTFNAQEAEVSPSQSDIWDQLNCGYIRIKLFNKRDHITDDSIKIEYLSKFFEKEKKFLGGFGNDGKNSPQIHPINKDGNNEMLSHILSDMTEVNNLLMVEDTEINTHSHNTVNVRLKGSFNDSKNFLLKPNNREASNLTGQYTSSTNITSIALINQLVKKRNLLHKFCYIGRKFITIDDCKKSIVLELYARITANVCELLFNDITKLHLYHGLQQFIIQSGQYLHDFKNPLICINDDMNELKIHNDYIYTLLLNNPDTNTNEITDTYFRTTEKFEYLIKMSEYCRGMIASYEDFSKFIFKPKEVKLAIEKIELEEVFSFVDSMMKFKIFKSNKNVEFILLRTSCEGKVICNDKIKLKQVLINILSNSEKFTSRGSITLIANEEVIDGKKFIKFLIKDTGIGMSKSVIDSLCTPFYSLNANNLNNEGCGLGLVIVKQLTEKMGIGLKISSIPGEGTQMWFCAEDFNGDGGVSQDMVSDLKQITLSYQKYIPPQQLIKQGSKNFTIQEQESENNANDTFTFPCDRVEKKNSGKSIATLNSHLVKSLTGRKKVHEQTCFEKKFMTQSSYGKSPQKRERKWDMLFNSSILPKNTMFDFQDDFEVSQSRIGPKFDLKSLEVVQENCFSYKPQILLSPTKKASQTLSPYYEGRRSESIRKWKPRLSIKVRRMSNFESNIKTAHETNYNETEFSKKQLLDHQDFNDSFVRRGRSSMKSITNFGFPAKGTIGSFNDFLNQQSNDNDGIIIKDDFLMDFSNIINVLIIDDDDRIRSCTKKIFQKIEASEKKYIFRIDEADDGFRGLIKIIDKNVNHSEKYDIIIIDDEMNYLNGTDLFKLLSYIADNKFGVKSNFDMNIISRILICSGDAKLVKNKLRISDEAIASKPLSQNFLSAYVRKFFEV